MKVGVVFGSSSDKIFYQKLMAELDLKHVPYDLKVASAHKTPSLVDNFIENNYDLYVAGAGLSAALPGVVASKTIRPVIGIPLSGAFSGLDALLSVWQIPTGIAVLGAPIENIEEPVKFAELYMKGLDKIVLIERTDEKAAMLCAKADNFFKENNIAYSKQKTDFPQFNDLNTVYIDFVDLSELSLIGKRKAAVINVPYLRRESNANDALKLLNAKNGLWVGLNIVENACLAAVQLVNKDKKYDDFLLNYRKKLAEKIMAAK